LKSDISSCPKGQGGFGYLNGLITMEEMGGGFNFTSSQLIKVPMIKEPAPSPPDRGIWR